MKKTIVLLVLIVFCYLVTVTFAAPEPESYAPPGNPQSHEEAPTSSQDNTSGITGSRTDSQGMRASATSEFPNPIIPKTVEQVLTSVMGYLRGIAGTIAVIFIIIGGIMYMISGGSDMTETAKKTVIYALVGLAIVIAAPLFYQEIKAILSGGSPGSALQQILFNTLRLLLSIVGFLAIITMVVGAIWMFTAVGDEDRYELGKKTATYSIIGLAIAVGSLILADQVVKLIGGR